MATPQFGLAEPGRGYRDRPAAFGVLVRDGLVALVRVEKPGLGAWLDLPGGAVERGETDSAALVREFGEETGLKVAPGRLLGRADQYFINTGDDPCDNRQAIFEALWIGEAPDLKIEADHTLVWLPAQEAISRLRHDSHAWAVSLALRCGMVAA